MDLLDVFGGQDNLVLMCEARRFKRDGDRSVSFWVGPYIVRVSKGTYTDCNGIYYPYHLYIFHRKTKDCPCNRDIYSVDLAQSVFSRCTGFVLEF
jgi:hypothetical protein